MKVRIRKSAGIDHWYVETKQWWQIEWRVVAYKTGGTAELEALALALEYADPVIIEVRRGRRHDC